MATTIWEIALTPSPLAAPGAADSVAAGAVLEFWGVVRAQEADVTIGAIDYVAHPTMAKAWLERVARETAERFPLENGCVLFHRTGMVPVGQPSLYVRILARHRGEALGAMGWLITRLKEVVPIWKHPVLLIDDRGSVPAQAGLAVNSSRSRAKIELHE